jgi:uncharacterized membrane protein YhaH (DUF805 family)
MLLIVIAALCAALAVQSRRAHDREQELQMRLFLMIESHVQFERQMKLELAELRKTRPERTGKEESHKK